ncbi:MAG: hypothetical protein SFT81_01695 [Candidatus Caenarcaniphilales bacterium]|nr:hypothetical protein [Candidatus Caenarcaniphilales bacterium]
MVVYHFGRSRDFSLTPYGWGFFARPEILHQPDYSLDYDLPLSLSQDGKVLRVHLWVKQAKNLKLRIDPLHEVLTSEKLKVPVQYSFSGGTFAVQERQTQRTFTGKQIFQNIFAHSEDYDDGGFV